MGTAPFTLDVGSAAGVVGEWVCRTPTGVTRANAAAMTTYGAVFGCLVSAGNPATSVRVCFDGHFPASITGLGAVAGKARLNTTTCRAERVASLSGFDYPIGDIDSAGNLEFEDPPEAVGTVAELEALTTPKHQSFVYVSERTGHFRFDATSAATVGSEVRAASDGSRGRWLFAGTQAAVAAVQTGSFSASANQFVPVDTSAGPVTTTLPTAVGNAGRTVRVRKTSLDRNAARVVGLGSELIDGVSARAFDGPQAEASFISDGVGYYADPPLPHTPAELTLRFWYRADRINRQGSSCTRWLDLSGNKFHLEAPSAAARPTVKTTLIQPALTFDGTNDEMFYNAAMAGADFPVTIVVISRMNVSSQTGYLVDFTDQLSSHTSARSCSVFQGEGGGFRIARYPGSGNGAFAAFSSTGLVYDYAEFTAGERRLSQDGTLQESGFGGDLTSFLTATPKVHNGVRVANGWAQSAFFNGDICEIIGIDGIPNAGQRAYLDRYIFERYGILAPFGWPFEPATDAVSDPHLILPSTVDVIAATPLEVLKYNVSRRDGTTAKTVTCPGQTVSDLVDRWRVTPPAVATPTFTVLEAGFQDAMTINAVAALSGGAPTRNVLVVGDSISDNGSGGVCTQLLKEALGPRITLVGTKTITVGPRTHKAEATSGQAWGYYATNVADSGSPAPSPFFSAGALNIATYLATLAGQSQPAPDIIIWRLGTNVAFLASAATVEAYCTTQHGHAATLMNAFTAQLPNVKHAIVTPFSGKAGQATWRAVHDRDHYDWRQCQVRVVEKVYADFGGQEVSNKRWIIPGHLSVDPVAGYYSTDPLHPNHPIGHVQIADRELAWLHAHWT